MFHLNEGSLPRVNPPGRFMRDAWLAIASLNCWIELGDDSFTG